MVEEANIASRALVEIVLDRRSRHRRSKRLLNTFMDLFYA